MSSNRQQLHAGGASSVPGTSSSSSAGGAGNTNGSGGSNAVTSNGSNSGNVVPSRTLAAATSEGGLSVPTLAAVPSSRGGFASLSRPSASSGSRKKSLHQTPLCNGLLNSYEDKSNDFVWLVETNKQTNVLFSEAGVYFWTCNSRSFCCLLLQSHLLRNDRRGTHDKVWAQFLVSGHSVTFV